MLQVTPPGIYCVICHRKSSEANLEPRGYGDARPWAVRVFLAIPPALVISHESF